MNTEMPDQQPAKKSFMRQFNEWRLRCPVIFNILMIFVAALVVAWFIFIYLDYLTLHGKEQEMPDVKGLVVTDAKVQLERDGMTCHIADSIYDASSAPGTVVEQKPHAFSRIKPGQTAYLTIVAYNPKMVTLPNVVNSSLRQARSMIEAVGLKNITVRQVPSEYPDLVLGITVDGKEIMPGSRVPVNAKIVLMVGDGADIGDMDGDGSEQPSEAETVATGYYD